VSDPTFDLEGKVALITGGNRGIGLGIAEALARSGANVCIWGRDEQKNREAERRLLAHGRRVMALACDISDEDRVEECLQRTLAEFGRVDSCFANAGVLTSGTRFHLISSEEWHRVFRVNMDGVFFTFKHAIRHMLERRGGSLVVTSSLSALKGMPRAANYAATKAGVVAMIRSIASDYARDGIRANAILAGWTDTEMTGSLIGWDKFREAVVSRIPLGRWGAPADYGGIAVYFASDASAFHTGDAIVIDGGFNCM
jgi:NAD(P)-dependent dehydrogenase (short-subunit alcohol dehydrogenase family)